MAQSFTVYAHVSEVGPALQVYKNNGLPVGAAVGVPLGAIALAAGLLYLAHLNRKRTARYALVASASPACRAPPRAWQP